LKHWPAIALSIFRKSRFHYRKSETGLFFFDHFFFHFINSSTIDFLFLMIFIQEYTMFWFGFDDYARRHLFVWNIILKHDVVINYQRIPYKLGIVCIFFTTRNRHSETQIDWQFFLGFICVGQAISWAWLNPFESSDATPTFWNLQILTMAKIYKVYGMVLIQPSVKQKPGIRMLINCERRSLDKEKQKEKRSSQLWILVCAFGCWQ